MPVGRTIREWLVVTLACVLVAAAVTQLGWLWRIDQAIYDVSMASGQRAVDRDVLIVAIDERSLAELGRWPWPRTVHAELLERLRAVGAAPVALDILFAEPVTEDPAGDARLAAAIRAHGRVVLPVSASFDARREPDEHKILPLFAASAAALGHAHVEFDPDGIVRSVYLWDGPAHQPQPQLGLALLGLTDPAIAARYGEVVPAAAGWRQSGLLRIPFAGPPGAFEQVSYVDVLKGRIESGRLQGRALLVGAVAAGLGDMVPTPTSAFTRPMAGVEINANIYSALRRGAAVYTLPPGLAAGGAGLIVLAMMFAVLRLTPRQSLLTAYGISIGVLGWSWVLLQYFQLWMPPAGAVLGCVLAYPLWSWRRLEATQSYLDEELDALHREANRWQAQPGGERFVRDADPLHGRLDFMRETASRQRQLRHFMIDTLEGLPTGVVVVAPSGLVQLHNHRAATLLGSSDPVLLMEALRAIEWPDELPRHNGIPRAPGEPRAVEVQVGARTLHVSIAALHDRRSRMHGVVLGLDDITAIKEAQARREETMQYLSHDLRAPLSSILTLVETARETAELTPAAARESLQRVGHYARSALELTENLFRLVRAEVVDVRRFVLFDLQQIADDAAEEAWALARAKGIRIRRVDTVEDECLVLCEPSMLKRAVLNLLTNAIKYSPSESEISLRIDRRPPGWALAVTDQGEGIRAEDLSQLFKRFGRLELESGRRVAGIGLGLMIVKTVVERHGGKVEVDSQPGRGSCFTLQLPSAPQ